VADSASFGEQGGLLTYGQYLRVPELLAQQVDTLRWLTHRHVTAADLDPAAAAMAKVAETLRR
jgi:hypothetical protein